MICISLLITSLEPLCMCLFDICVSSLEKVSIGVFCPFFGLDFYFFYCFGMQLYQNCWCILNINLLLAVPFTNSTFHSALFPCCWWLLCKSFYVYFSFIFLLVCFVYFNFFCIKQMNQEVVPPFMSEIPMFSYMSSMVLYRTFRFSNSFEFRMFCHFT